MKNQTIKETFFPSNILQFILLFVIGVIVSSPILFFESYFEKLTFDHILFVLFFLVIVVTTTLINKSRKIKWNISFKIVKHPFLARILLSTIIFQFGINAPVNLIVSSSIDPNYTIPNPFNPMIFVIGAIFLGSFVEEILFRGILLNGLLYKNKASKAIILSSIVFSIIHFNPYQLTAAFCLGIILGNEFYKTGSLGNSIIMHALANLAGLAGTYIFYKFFPDISQVNISYLITYITISCITISILLYKSKKHIL